MGELSTMSTAALLLILAGAPPVAQSAGNPHPSSRMNRFAHYTPAKKSVEQSELIFNVFDYGAKGDNSTDDTAAFAKAIGAARAAGGGTVIAPSSLYRFSGHLTIPNGVTLRGSYNVVPSHALVDGVQLDDGTVFIPLEGRGAASGPPFITIQSNALLSGVVIYYEEQERVQLPVAYPWTLFMTGNNAAVMDVELLGSFNGINATLAHRHYIARVQGQPLNIGVFVDSTYDIGRIEDVHFNPWFSNSQPFVTYQLTHGRAFVFGRSDWEYVFNTFAFGYAIGYHFISTPTGQMNGNFLGIGADLATNVSVLVDASQAPGILITNGEFTAFHDDQWLPNSTVESSHVVVSPTNTGPVKFVDSSFWGPASQVALLEGKGSTTFSGCQFVQWDEQKKDGRSAIQIKAGRLVLQGNEFGQDKAQVEAWEGVEKVVVTGNLFAAGEKITIRGGDTVKAIGMNA